MANSSSSYNLPPQSQQPIQCPLKTSAFVITRDYHIEHPRHTEQASSLLQPPSQFSGASGGRIQLPPLLPTLHPPLSHSQLRANTSNRQPHLRPSFNNSGVSRDVRAAVRQQNSPKPPTSDQSRIEQTLAPHQHVHMPRSSPPAMQQLRNSWQKVQPPSKRVTLRPLRFKDGESQKGKPSGRFPSGGVAGVREISKRKAFGTEHSNVKKRMPKKRKEDIPVPAEAGDLEKYQKKLTPFVYKLYAMVCTPEFKNAIHWTEDGRSFVVESPEHLADHILSKYFKHERFESFIRQLNKYRFRKVSDKHQVFRNEWFQRNKVHLLECICEGRQRSPARILSLKQQEKKKDVQRRRTEEKDNCKDFKEGGKNHDDISMEETEHVKEAPSVDTTTPLRSYAKELRMKAQIESQLLAERVASLEQQFQKIHEEIAILNERNSQMRDVIEDLKDIHEQKRAR